MSLGNEAENGEVEGKKTSSGRLFTDSGVRRRHVGLCP
jgi:hypothetical protein